MILAQLHPNILVAGVDATSNGVLARQYSIKFYPTLIWIAKGTFEKASIGLSSSSLIDWVLQRDNDAFAATDSQDGLQACSAEGGGCTIEPSKPIVNLQATKEEIQRFIAAEKVVIFSKTNCLYCQKTISSSKA